MKIAYKEHMDGGNQAMRWRGDGAWSIWTMDGCTSWRSTHQEAPIQNYSKRGHMWATFPKQMGKSSSKNSSLWAPKFEFSKLSSLSSLGIKEHAWAQIEANQQGHEGGLQD